VSVTDDVRAMSFPHDDDRAPRGGGPGPGGPGGAGPGGGGGGGGYDRTPPQDIAAEQCVLGGMLLSKDAIADVVEIVRTADFYRPAHATIFDAVLDLYGRGEPADPITVAAALADSGDLNRVGGVPYLHDLVAIVPTAANAAYYGRIVAERAVLRRLVEAGTRIVQLGYGAAGNGGRDVDDTVDLAQQEIYNVTERRGGDDFAVLAELLQPTLDEIEAVGAQGGVMTGVPTGFTDLDRLLNGLHGGQLIIVAGRPGLGKALALDTPVPTPTGWTTMGAVRAGDQLLGADGRPTTVLQAFDVLYDRPCFEVEFSDGSTIVADGEHLWLTHTRESRHYGHPRKVRNTAEVAATLRYGTPATGPNHSVDACAPLELPAADLPIAPYTLGRRLGGEDHVPDERIPPTYLRASVAQRRALLAGLLNARGNLPPAGTVELTVTSARLAADVRELIVSLGYQVSLVTRPAPDGTRATYTIRTGPRYVTAVRPAASVPVRCVTVDNEDHLYLAGRSMIPTHNSTAGMDFVRSAAVKHNLASAIFSLEMSKVEIVMRLLAAEARVPLHVLRSGQLSDDDWTKLARRMGEISEAPLFVDDTPSMTLMEIRAKARRLKQRHDLKLIVVDYLQLMTSPKRTESRQQEVAELSRGMKLLAKEIECPVVAVSQLNRGPEQRTDKRPQLSDLRESGCLTASTRVLRADTNAEVSLGDLLAAGARDIPIWALDERLMYVPRTMTHVFPSGRKPVFRLGLASGRSIEATGNHPFLTVDGWRSLDTLAAGGRVAAPRHVPGPLQPNEWPDAAVVTLARRLGAGFAAGATPHLDDVSGSSKRQVTLFLRHLWSTGGSAAVRGNGIRVHFATRNRRLADGVAMLLLRFGITTRVGTGSFDSLYTVDISGRDDQLRFLREIAAPGPKLLALLGKLERSPNLDTIPREVWDQVRAAIVGPDVTERQFASIGSTSRGPAPGRQRLARIAGVLHGADLDLHATNDVLWDEIVAIDPIGERDVFDATVLGLHNFIANGIAVHNSIEQDADVVILLHRDDYYDKESPRAGEADFIVAKHRNGPTDTITVAAQLHLSRFVDMAIV
jgi:replicative DNA helicase